MVLTVFPTTRIRFARVLLKGPVYRSTARSGQKAQAYKGCGQIVPTVKRHRSQPDSSGKGHHRPCNIHMWETLWAVLTIVSKTSLIVAVLMGVRSGASPHKIAWVVYETLEFSARFVKLGNDPLGACVSSGLKRRHTCAP